MILNVYLFCQAVITLAATQVYLAPMGGHVGLQRNLTYLDDSRPGKEWDCHYVTFLEWEDPNYFKRECLEKNQGSVRSLDINGETYKPWGQDSSIGFVRNCTVGEIPANSSLQQNNSSDVFLSKHTAYDRPLKKGDIILVYRSYDVVCKEGYRLSGTQTVQCMENGNFSASPKCIIEACQPLNLHGPNVQEACDVHNPYHVGKTCNITCPHSQVTSSITCQGNGTWSQIPDCHRQGYVRHSDNNVWQSPGKELIVAAIMLVLGSLIAYIVYHKHFKKKSSILITDSSGTPSSIGSSKSQMDEEKEENIDTEEDPLIQTKSLPPPPYDEQQELSYNSGTASVGIKAVQTSVHDSGIEFQVMYANRIYNFSSPQKGRITVTEGATVRLSAICKKEGDSVKSFYAGPFFSSDLSSVTMERNVCTLTIQKTDKGTYLLYCQTERFEESVVLEICIADDNNTKNSIPFSADHDETDVKRPWDEEIDSINSTRPAQEMTCIDLQKQRKIQTRNETKDGGHICVPTRTCTSPAKLIKSRDSEADQFDAVPVDSCSMLFQELAKDKEAFSEICCKLEPIESLRPWTRTIQGAAVNILNFSKDRVDWICWAKRENLQNSPARVLLTFMIQHGIKVGHLVQYYSQASQRRNDVIEVIEGKHKNCDFCKQFYRCML